MTLTLSIRMDADASALKRASAEGQAANDQLGASLDAIGAKAAAAAGKLDAAAAAAERLRAANGGGAPPPGPVPGSPPVPPSPGPAPGGQPPPPSPGPVPPPRPPVPPPLPPVPPPPGPGPRPPQPPVPPPPPGPVPPPSPGPGPGPGPRTGLRSDQWSNLAYQGNDIVTSLSMGMSPMQVLAQQGGQVVQILSDAPGGVAGGLKIVGERVMSILTPARLAAGGFVALGAAMAAAGIQWSQSQSAIEKGLTGIGAMSRATVGDINRIAEEASTGSRGRLSTGEARGVATTIAATGKVDVSNIRAVAGLAPGYAELFGKDLTEAGADLARIFSDPVKGAEELNARIGGLDASTQRYVRTLVDQGHRQEAIRVLVSRFAPEIEKAAEKTGLWTAAWNLLGSAADAAGRIIAGPFVTAPPDERLKDIEEQLSAAEYQRAVGGGGDNTKEIERLTKELAQILQEASDKEASAIQKAAAERSQVADANVRSLVPEIDQLDQYQIKLEQLRGTQNDLNALAGMSAEARRGLTSAVAAATGAVETHLTAQEKARASEALTVRSIEARTAAQKAAVEAERERLALAGQAISAEDRQQRIAAARSASFAQNTREAQDRLRSAEDAAAGAGLTGLPRRLAEMQARERRALEGAEGNLPAYSATQAAFGIERRAATAEAIAGPLRDADRSIAEQAAGLRLQQAAFGASTEAAERMAAAQQLVNRYTADGVPVEGDLRRAIEERAAAVGKLAAAQEDLARRQRSVVGSMDDLRYGLRGGITGALGDVVNGRNPLDSLAKAGERTALSLIERTTVEPLISGLLGSEGKPGGGLLGDTLGGLFGKAAGLPSADITAGVVNVTGPISGLGGLAGAAANGNMPGGSVASLVGGGLPGIGGRASTFGGSSAEAAGGILSRLSGSKAEVAEYVRQAAIARGIDPNVALRVVNQESGFNRLATNLTSKEQSYGVMQLNTMGGLGVDAMKAGIDVRDPSTWQRQVDFGFDTIKRDGWRQWYGARDIGVSRWEGIGQGVPAAPAAAAPAAPAAPAAVAPLSGLDASLGTISGSATKAAEGVASLSGDLSALPGPLAQTSQGLNQVGGALGSGGGGGLLGMIAQLFSGGAGAGAGAATATVAAATGGHIRGPGTGTSDSILARVSNGEFVVRAAAARDNLDLLHAINDNRLPVFAAGGIVGQAPPAARPQMRERVAEAASAQAGGAGVNVQVHNYAGVEVEQTTKRRPDGGQDIRVELRRMVADELARPGSEAGRALEGTWGLSRTLARRG